MSGRQGRQGSARVPMRLGIAAVLVAGSVAVVLAGARGGYPVSRERLAGGAAWLASPGEGLVTLVDGVSEQVVGSVRAPGADRGDDLATVQSGSSVYVVDNTAGSVSRVDGATYETSAPVRFGDPVAPGGSSRLQAYVGADALYVVDGRRRVAMLTDPVRLSVRDRIALAGQPGAGQSVVDGDGRLWVADASGAGVSRVDRSGVRGTSGLGDGASQLVLVRDRPVLVDQTRSRVGRLAADATVGSWSCLQAPPGVALRLLGSAGSDRVFAAVPSTGTLVMAGVDGDDCGTSVDIGHPGDDLGAPVESGGFVLVPDRTTGHTVVVDVAAHRAVADLDLLGPGHRLDLVAKDGLVFYNDLDGDTAGVIRFDGTRWTAGHSVRKFGQGSGQLTPGGAGATLGSAGDAGAGGNAAGPGPAAGTAPAPGPLGGTPSGLPPGRNPAAPAGPVLGAAPPAGQQVNGPPPGPTTGGTGGTGDPGTGGPPPPGDPGPGGQPPPPADLALTVVVTGGGFVTPQSPVPADPPASGRCDSDTTCVWNYPAATTVVLKIPESPSAAWVLSGLSGCQATDHTAGSSMCTVTLDAARTVRATYTPPQPSTVTLAVGTAGTGAGTVTATPAGAPASSCDPGCSLTVTAGTEVTLTEVEGRFAYLASWGVAGCAATSSTCVVTPAADMSVTVTFSPLLGLTYGVSGSGHGTVDADGNPCSTTCSSYYQPGTRVTLTATPDATSTFGGWSNCPAPQGTRCVIVMSAWTTVTATLTHVDSTPPVITLSGGGVTVHNAGSGDGSISTNAASITFTASATDPDGPVTGLELWEDSYSFTCTDGHIAQRVTGDIGAPSATSAGGPVSYTIPLASLASCPKSMPTLEQANFGVYVKATSAGGTATSAGIGITYT